MSKTKKRLIWLVVIVVIIAGGVYYFKTKKTLPQLTTETVRKGDLAQTVSVTGTIVSHGETDLNFKSAGRIVSLDVKVGDNVKKGEKIAQLERGTLSDALAQARADVRVQKETYENMREHKNLFTKDQRDAQKAVIEKAEAALSAVMTQIDETVLSAPADGIISKVNYKKGEVTTVALPVAILSGENDLELETNVPESDIVKVAVGQKATVTLDAFSSDEKLEAEIIEIEPSSTVIQDVVYYKVRLKLFDDPRFRNGMSADIDIKTAESKNVLMVPLRAVKTEGGQKFVEVLKDGKTGTTERKNVTVGLDGDDGMVEIESGISEGEKVVTLTKSK